MVLNYILVGCPCLQNTINFNVNNFITLLKPWTGVVAAWKADVNRKHLTSDFFVLKKGTTRMCDQWKRLQCWWRTGNSPSFFVPTLGNLPYPEVKKVLMPGGQAQVEGGWVGGAGRSPRGVLGISSDGDDRRIFWGLKFSIPGFFWVRKFGKYFFW